MNLIKKEKELLSSLYDYLSIENKFFLKDIEIGKIDTVLVLKDYISFYLDKNNLKKKNYIIKENNVEPIKLLLMKIIWIETKF